MTRNPFHIPKSMRILLINHGTAGKFVGGDSTQIKNTALQLRASGHEVTMVNSDEPDVRGYDIAHIFNCRVFDSFVKQMNCCLEAGIPTVVSPIWINIPKALWGSRGTLGILSQVQNGITQDQLKNLERLKTQELVVSIPEGTVDARGGGSCNFDWMQTVGQLLKKADGLLPNSWLELKAVQNDFAWSGNCFEIAHYGVDPKIFLDADPAPFREATGIEGPFVVQGGRIEPSKNQAMLCWALRNTDLPLVLIGSGENWPSYPELCKKFVGNRLTIIEHLPQEMLASAFAAASVHVLPSWMETCGLVTLEAALTGTPVVGSTFGHELEYLQENTWWCNPGDAESIQIAVEKAWNSGKGHKKTKDLKERIINEFSWQKTAEKTEKLYLRVLCGR